MEVDKDGTYDARPMWTAMFIPGPEEDKQLQTEKQTPDPCDPLRDLKPHGLAFCCLNTSSIFLLNPPPRSPSLVSFGHPLKCHPLKDAFPDQSARTPSFSLSYQHPLLIFSKRHLLKLSFIRMCVAHHLCLYSASSQTTGTCLALSG